MVEMNEDQGKRSKQANGQAAVNREGTCLLGSSIQATYMLCVVCLAGRRREGAPSLMLDLSSNKRARPPPQKKKTLLSLQLPPVGGVPRRGRAADGVQGLPPGPAEEGAGRQDPPSAGDRDRAAGQVAPRVRRRGRRRRWVKIFIFSSSSGRWAVGEKSTFN